MAGPDKSIHQLDLELCALIKEITRLAVKGGGAELDAATVAYRRAGAALSSNMGRITKAMKAEGSPASRCRTGEGVVLGAQYAGLAPGFGLGPGEKWPSGFKIA